MESIEIISHEKLPKGTVRTILKIKGHVFKRLYNHQTNSIAWNDEELTIGECVGVSEEHQVELESIFTAFVIERLKNDLESNEAFNLR